MHPTWDIYTTISRPWDLKGTFLGECAFWTVGAGLARMNKPLMENRAYTPDESARYRVLVEAITDYAVYMLDPGGIVSSWNAGAQRFEGYTREEIIGQHFARFYTKEDLANNLPARALEISAHEGKFEGEGWHVRKDGSRFWAHVIIDP